MSDPQAVRAELRNLAANSPVSPGDTISHATARELVRLGWAARNHAGDFIITREGRNAFLAAEAGK